MQTNIQNPPPATPNFPGIVMDPISGRLCALQVDIFHGLGLAGCQVRATKPRIYQSRYFDILDVIEARAKVGKKGRPTSNTAAQ